MSKEILINVESQERRIAIVNNERLEEFYIERPQDKTIVGSIYNGKIEAVLPSIGGAFVNIGLPKNGFLYLSEIEPAFEPLEEIKTSNKEVNPVRNTESIAAKNKISNGVKKGQDVLVQVVKESFGTKGPRLSCDIGIAGRYLVLMPQDAKSGISRRIEDEAERRRLKQILLELHLPKDMGFIVRTVSSGKSKEDLLRDARFLIKLWGRIKKDIPLKKAPSLIYEEYDLTLRTIRDSFTEEVSKLIVDSKQEYFRILRFLRSFSAYLSRRVELYKGSDLFEEKNIDRQINSIFESKVYLKSKAYIVIEPTEGLVVIDVNSGGFKTKLRQEDTAFKVNCEAAVEAVRQLILRDLGGIIVIDFIDMEKEAHRREVLNVFKNALSNDKAKSDILGISKFGVVEMTRERVHNTVQTLSYQSCPFCQGRGKVKSPLTMSIYATRNLKKFLKGKTLAYVNVSAHPLVIEELLRNKSDLEFIEHRFRTKINLVSNPSMHIEDVKILDPNK